MKKVSTRLVLGSVTGVEVLWREARVRPMTVGEAVEIAGWRYGGDWSVYDLATPPPVHGNLASYFVVTSGNEVIGFCCIGVEAQVAGMTAAPATLDIGMGMNPQRVGRGNGARFGEIVLKYLDERHPGITLRAAVQAWNARFWESIIAVASADAIRVRPARCASDHRC